MQMASNDTTGNQTINNSNNLNNNPQSPAKKMSLSYTHTEPASPNPVLLSQIRSSLPLHLQNSAAHGSLSPLRSNHHTNNNNSSSNEGDNDNSSNNTFVNPPSKPPSSLAARRALNNKNINGNILNLSPASLQNLSNESNLIPASPVSATGFTRAPPSTPIPTPNFDNNNDSQDFNQTNVVNNIHSLSAINTIEEEPSASSSKQRESQGETFSIQES